MTSFTDLPIDIVKYNIINKLVYNIYNTNKNNKIRFIQDNFDFCLVSGEMCYKSKNKNQNFILSHLKNIYKLRGINKELNCLVDNPFNLNDIEKSLITKRYLGDKDLDESSIIYDKIISNLTLISKNPILIINDIIESYKDEVQINMKLVLKEFIASREPCKYISSNDTCKICDKTLPLYWSNVRNNWQRSIKDKFEPRALLKRCCSKKCLKQINNRVNVCLYCYGRCGHLFDYHNTTDSIFYTYRNARIISDDEIELGELQHILETYYPTDIFCSRSCKSLFDKRTSMIDNSNIFELNEIFDDEFTDIHRSQNIVNILRKYPCVACKDGIINPILSIKNYL